MARTALRDLVADISHLKPQPERIYSAYRARGGATITPNVLSPGQRADFDHWASVITTETGIERNPLRKPGPKDAKKIADVWINHLSRLKEDFRENYAEQRNQLAEEGRYGVSVVLQHNALVCRELSVVASALFAEFGIETQIGSGFVEAKTKTPGAHAWLEVLGKNNSIDLIVDSNFKRQTYPSFKDYYRASKGVTYRKDQGGGQQKIVHVRKANMFADMTQASKSSSSSS